MTRIETGSKETKIGGNQEGYFWLLLNRRHHDCSSLTNRTRSRFREAEVKGTLAVDMILNELRKEMDGLPRRNDIPNYWRRSR
ncbi:unnamed protein product [Linum tenue]|uniref:Uncharacterized protein n=1 Tax=Linum tenue TaxID=586396 RepID=A0AAV0NP70_9ROSI|nr:unnamed protein product [Linum tenue]